MFIQLSKILNECREGVPQSQSRKSLELDVGLKEYSRQLRGKAEAEVQSVEVMRSGKGVEDNAIHYSVRFGST